MLIETNFKFQFHIGHSEIFLFDGWTVTEVGSFIVSTFAVFFAAIIYEGLKYYREKLFTDYTHAEIARAGQNGKNEGCSTGCPQPRRKTFKDQIFSRLHLLQTALHLIQVILSYFLMLIVMTYNVWLFLAVVLGATLGYWGFGWIRNRSIDLTEHCH